MSVDLDEVKRVATEGDNKRFAHYHGFPHAASLLLECHNEINDLRGEVANLRIALFKQSDVAGMLALALYRRQNMVRKVQELQTKNANLKEVLEALRNSI